MTAETTGDGFRFMHFVKVVKVWPIGKQKPEHACSHLVPLLIAAAIFAPCTITQHGYSMGKVKEGSTNKRNCSPSAILAIKTKYHLIILL